MKRLVVKELKSMYVFRPVTVPPPTLLVATVYEFATNTAFNVIGPETPILLVAAPMPKSSEFVEPMSPCHSEKLYPF